MKRLRFVAGAVIVFAGAVLLLMFAGTRESLRASAPPFPASQSFLGFDRNEYPGDAGMKILRHDFSFTGFWLSPPPGEKTNRNSWTGKREFLRAQGFGFLALYRGRDSRELKNDSDAKEKGTLDARNAATAAKAEGFSPGSTIFLDIEEGGRLPSSYHLYLRAFADGIVRDGYRPGVYCSGMPVKEEPGVSITTAEDIRASEAPREFIFWVYNDACPPSPGCALPQEPPPPATSGIKAAAVWQYAQSPRRKEFSAHCPAKYAPDGNCYAPSDSAHRWFLDLNSSSSPDPSSGSK